MIEQQTDPPMSVPAIFRAVSAAADFERSMRKVARALAGFDWTELQRLVDQVEGYDVHHPRPLPINGDEYRRRRRNR